MVDGFQQLDASDSHLIPYLDIGLGLEPWLWIVGKTEFRDTIPEFWIWPYSRMGYGEASRVRLGLDFGLSEFLGVVHSLPR